MSRATYKLPSVTIIIIIDFKLYLGESDNIKFYRRFKQYSPWKFINMSAFLKEGWNHFFSIEQICDSKRHLLKIYHLIHAFKFSHSICHIMAQSTVIMKFVITTLRGIIILGQLTVFNSNIAQFFIKICSLSSFVWYSKIILKLSK